MSLDQFKIDTDVEESKADVLPGSGFTMNTGLYPMIVEVAFTDKSTGGAQALKVHLKMADGSPQTSRQTFWTHSGNAKGNKNYYIHKKTGKKHTLPGMILADQLAHVLCDKGIHQLTQEEKVIKLWDSNTQQEEPTKVQILSEMTGKPVLVGMHKVRDNKVAKNGKGGYDKIADERFFNEIDRVFLPDGLTVTEKAAGETEPKFHDRWQERYPADYVMDRYIAVAGGQPSMPSNGATAAPKAPVNDLFEKKE